MEKTNKIKKLWQETLEQLNETLPESMTAFISNIALNKIEDDAIYLSCPSEFALKNIQKQEALIKNTFADKLEKEYKIKFIVDNTQKKEYLTKPSTTKKSSEKKSSDVAKVSKNTTLNKNYTLDNFICGDNSTLAYQTARIIAMNPGTSLNPCLIYGGVGLGKTHLLQSIGNYIDKENPKKKIIYVTAESFTNEFIASIANNSSKNQFKQKYRNVDVLLLDDIHFLQKKESTQEELFHIFNELYENSKQIVFTCDRPITELTDITDRLRTRFTRGCNVDLTPPKYEVRMAIAKQKCNSLGLNIPDETLDFICQSVKTNVRDLEGALITVNAVSSIIKQPASIELAKEHIKNIIVEPAMNISSYTIDDVFTATANYFNVSLIDMKGKSRSKNIIIPRQIAIYISYKYGKHTQTDIGKYLNKDHTTIGFTVSKIEPLLEADDNLQKTIRYIKEKLDSK